MTGMSLDRVGTIAPYSRPHFRSTSPLNGSLLSYRALAGIPPDRIPNYHCEMRLGALPRTYGFEPMLFPPPLLATNENPLDLIDFDPDRPPSQSRISEGGTPRSGPAPRWDQ